MSEFEDEVAKIHRKKLVTVVLRGVAGTFMAWYLYEIGRALL